jgi:hypothetical protein
MIQGTRWSSGSSRMIHPPGPPRRRLKGGTKLFTERRRCGSVGFGGTGQETQFPVDDLRDERPGRREYVLGGSAALGGLGHRRQHTAEFLRVEVGAFEAHQARRPRVFRLVSGCYPSILIGRGRVAPSPLDPRCVREFSRPLTGQGPRKFRHFATTLIRRLTVSIVP